MNLSYAIIHRSADMTVQSAMHSMEKFEYTVYNFHFPLTYNTQTVHTQAQVFYFLFNAGHYAIQLQTLPKPFVCIFFFNYTPRLLLEPNRFVQFTCNIYLHRYPYMTQKWCSMQILFYYTRMHFRFQFNGGVHQYHRSSYAQPSFQNHSHAPPLQQISLIIIVINMTLSPDLHHSARRTVL